MPGLNYGRFTPSFNVGATYTRQEGQYSICGDLLFFTLQLTGVFEGNLTGNLTVVNLPYANADYIPGMVSSNYKMAFKDNVNLCGGFIDRGGSSILLIKQDSNCMTSYLNSSVLSNEKFNIILHGYYKIKY